MQGKDPARSLVGALDAGSLWHKIAAGLATPRNNPRLRVENLCHWWQIIVKSRVMLSVSVGAFLPQTRDKGVQCPPGPQVLSPRPETGNQPGAQPASTPAPSSHTSTRGSASLSATRRSLLLLWFFKSSIGSILYGLECLWFLLSSPNSWQSCWDS